MDIPTPLLPIYYFIFIDKPNSKDIQSLIKKRAINAQLDYILIHYR